MAENTNVPPTGRTNAFQDALGIGPGPWTADRVINSTKNAGANVLWGAKDWGDAGRNLGGAFSGKDTEGNSLGIWDRVKKGAAGVGDAALGALSVASTAALAIPVAGEAAKAATVAAQVAKAAKAAKAAEATKAGGSTVSSLKPGGGKPVAPSAAKGAQFPKDELFFPKGGKTKTPLKPMPSSGGAAPRGGTTVLEAPSSTRPDFNPLRDTKPFDPLDNPKTNPWPGMPKIEPKPAAPKPAPAPAPKPATTKPKTSTPWKPTSTVKPDAVKTNAKPSTSSSTEVKPQTEMKPSTGVRRKVALGTGAASAVGLMGLLPKPKTDKDKAWNPSSVV